MHYTRLVLRGYLCTTILGARRHIELLTAPRAILFLHWHVEEGLQGCSIFIVPCKVEVLHNARLVHHGVVV